jgi:hypothetical protein
MRVTVSVGGRFHAFDLAKQLESRGALHQLITSYPAFETIKHGISKQYITPLITKEVFQRGWRKIPRALTKFYNPQLLFHNIFDTQAANKVGGEDIFVGWSSFALKSLKAAKNRGAITILERGSSHIEYQQLTRELSKKNWMNTKKLTTLVSRHNL